MPVPRLRLLHVAQPTTAGVARCVADLARAQAAAGHEVHVACPPEGDLAAEAQAMDVTFHAWPASRGPGARTPAEVRRLAAVVRQAQPQLVHLHSAKAGLAGRLLLRRRVPTVFQPHAWSFDAATGPMRAAALAWERTAVRWTSLLVCVSQAELEVGRSAGVRVERSAVIPNGVDVQVLLPADAAERTEARRQLAVSEAPLAVCVGRLTRQKGQDVLLSAWPRVRQEVPDAQLVLVGDGPERVRLEEAAGPGVVFAGESRDVARWLAAADVVVLPSRWEGMALVPLEAMARARSVVASDVAGMAESVPPEAGAIVPPEDAAGLATALADRLSGKVDADAEGVVGAAHVRQAHDLRTTLTSITAAYASALP